MQQKQTIKDKHYARNTENSKKQTAVFSLLWKYDACLFQLPWTSIRPSSARIEGWSASKSFWKKLDKAKQRLNCICQHCPFLRAMTDLYESDFKTSKPTRYLNPAQNVRSSTLQYRRWNLLSHSRGPHPNGQWRRLARPQNIGCCPRGIFEQSQLDAG